MSESFCPSPAATVNIDVSSSSQSVSLAISGRTQVRIMNDGSATVWINHGPSGVTAATTTGMPIGPGTVEVVTLAAYGSTAYLAAIAAGSTGKIYFTPGFGL